MAEIRELSPTLTDQIAAGEVIERPSSVVKELLENAIDAESTAITISFQKAGLKEITIEDNGIGIAPTQIDLAFRRHATSKIKNNDDLFRIKTLGFRGEALASMSAVAKVEITTAQENGAGVWAAFSESHKQEQKPIAAKKGTKISVQDLFYNTPARLKYLKSEKTEITRIIDIVNRIALSYPELAITLKNENKVLLQTSGNGNLRQDVANIYGRKLASEMLEFANQDQDFSISGLVTKPDVTRANRNYISILLNGRYIKNYQLANAIMTGYGSKLPSGKYPLVVLQIEMDPLLVDVNVHPTKQEVRLSKELKLGQLISQTIAATLQEHELVGDVTENIANPQSSTDFDQLLFNLNKKMPQEITAAPNPTGESLDSAEDDVLAEEPTPLTIQAPDSSLISPTWAQNVAIQQTLAPFAPVKNADAEVTTTSAQTLNQALSDLRYVGQLQSGYLICDSDNGFYLIDQKAAQARLNYDQLQKKLKAEQLTQQFLLTPLVLEFSNADYQRMLPELPVLAEWGFEFADFGQNTLILKAYPDFLPAGQENTYVNQLIELHFERKLTWDETLQQLMIQASQPERQQVGNFNQTTGQEFVEQLLQTTDPYQSPTGQLIIVHYQERDLLKMFKKV